MSAQGWGRRTSAQIGEGIRPPPSAQNPSQAHATRNEIHPGCYLGAQGPRPTNSTALCTIDPEHPPREGTRPSLGEAPRDVSVNHAVPVKCAQTSGAKVQSKAGSTRRPHVLGRVVDPQPSSCLVSSDRTKPPVQRKALVSLLLSAARPFRLRCMWRVFESKQTRLSRRTLAKCQFRDCQVNRRANVQSITSTDQSLTGCPRRERSASMWNCAEMKGGSDHCLELDAQGALAGRRVKLDRQLHREHHRSRLAIQSASGICLELFVVAENSWHA